MEELAELKILLEDKDAQNSKERELVGENATS